MSPVRRAEPRAARRVVVVGGGLAGIAAALACADAGCAVTLLEGRGKLGGLAHSFRRSGPLGDLDVDNGQHVFLRCCEAYRRLLARLGSDGDVRLQDRLDIPVRSPWTARTSRLRRGDLPAPAHLGASLLRYSQISLPRRLRFARAALAMRKVDRLDPAVDGRSFADWLTEHGQDRRVIDALWDLIGVATLNVRAEQASLALAAMVFQVGLLTDADAADIGWSLVPLQRLHGDAATRALAAAGASVHVNTIVHTTAAAGDGWRVEVRRRGGRAAGDVPVEDLIADDLILAVPPRAARRLAPEGTFDAAPDWADRLGSSPIINLHVIFDRQVMTGPFLAGVGTPIQWIFDRTRQSGLNQRSGLAAPGLAGPGLARSRLAGPGLAGPGGSGEPGARAAGAGPQYVAVSVSAADAYQAMPVARLRELLLPDLLALLPAARDARVLDFFVTREPHATFRAAPGSGALRRDANSTLPGLHVAGAWTDTGWPATMEGAVRSGEAAARALLARPIRQGVSA